MGELFLLRPEPGKDAKSIRDGTWRGGTRQVMRKSCERFAGKATQRTGLETISDSNRWSVMDKEIPAIAQVRNNFVTRLQGNGRAAQAAADAGAFSGEEILQDGTE